MNKKSPFLKYLTVFAAVALAFGGGVLGAKLLTDGADPKASESETEILIDDDPLIVDELPDLTASPEADGEKSENPEAPGTEEGSEPAQQQESGGEEAGTEPAEESPAEEPSDSESGAEPEITDSPLGPNETEIIR